MEEAGVGEKRHFVLVHGVCHGAWSWYKVSTLLAAAGHTVTALDLSASGADPRPIRDVGTFAEYSRPLLEAMGALPPGERVVLVGHSFGGMSVALAAERFPEKVAAAVFLAAFMPDCSSRPSYVLDELSKQAGDGTSEHPFLDTQFTSYPGADKPSVTMLFGPRCISSKLYQLSPPEDITLAKSLIRVGSLFQGDLSGQPPFSKDRYGSVKKVYILCEDDLTLPAAFQRWMTKNCPVNEVKVISRGADHVAMISKPQEVCRALLDIALTYY